MDGRVGAQVDLSRAGRTVAHEMRRRVAARLPVAVAFLLANAALASIFEMLRFPERQRAMMVFDVVLLLTSVVALLIVRMRREWAIGVSVVAVNVIGLLLNAYHASVNGQIGLSIWVLAALLASSVVLLPWGWRAQALASTGTILGYPLMLLSSETQTLTWAAGGAYLLVVAAMSAVGAALIGRYLATDLSLSEALSEREERLEQLLVREQAARRKAEAASRAKDEFLATVSHELRTPLTPILGWTHQLQHGDLNLLEKRKAIDAIDRSVRSLAQLIKDLVDVSRITQGKLSLSLRPVDVVGVVAAAIEPMRPATAAKRIQLEMQLPSEALIVSADPDRLQQIVWNLVSNAIKFANREGRVRVEVRSNPQHAEILVSDTGRGIAPSELPHVFERFWQGDGSSTRMHGGLGLGLAIVRHLTELHGGIVEAESPGEGQGATFHVRLPRAAELAHPRESGPPKAEQSLQGVSVLVVDDEDEAREMVRSLLEHRGVEVRTAESTRQALMLLDLWYPRLLISDLAMPQQDGFALIRTIREREAGVGGHLPALAFTARTRPEDRIEALAAGYDRYLPKPSDPDELLSMVAHLAFGDPRGGGAGARGASGGKASAASFPRF